MLFRRYPLLSLNDLFFTREPEKRMQHKKTLVGALAGSAALAALAFAVPANAAPSATVAPAPAAVTSAAQHASQISANHLGGVHQDCGSGCLVQAYDAMNSALAS
jgi:hypothetical protein